MSAIRCLFTAVVVLGLSSGCYTHNETSVSTSLDIGQQLLDLKEARDQEAITPDEHLKMRRSLLNRMKSDDCCTETSAFDTKNN